MGGKSKTAWSEKEVDTLINMYPVAARNIVLQALPGRSWAACRNMARTLKVSRLGADRYVGNCKCCGKLEKLRFGNRFPGFCYNCYRAAIQRRKVEVHTESGDRDIIGMMRSAEQKQITHVLPEIEALMKCERQILRQMEQIREREKTAYVNRFKRANFM